MEIGWFIFQVLVGYNLVLPFLFFICARQRMNHNFKVSNLEFDYAIIVTAYEETTFLPAVIDSILKLNYNNYLVYVVADNCDISHLQVDKDRVILLKPEQVLANNVKSHFYAIQHFRRPHEVLTIIDSDNLVDAEYLNELNVFFNQGFKAVQGLRKPKNLNTPIARLDAARDIYYHFYDGDILFRLGSSATLSGSGMAFKTNLYTASLRNLEISGAGFDKALQAQIVKKNRRIAFAPRAIVYDEKTKSSNQLVKQRSRWLNTWFKYAGLGFGLIRIGFKKRWVNPLLFGIVLLRPPLFIFLSLSVLCLLINAGTSLIGTVLWITAFSVFIFSFNLSLRKQQANRLIYNALWGIPKFVFFQFIALFFSKNANKRSVATKHQVNL